MVGFFIFIAIMIIVFANAKNTRHSNNKSNNNTNPNANAATVQSKVPANDKNNVHMTRHISASARSAKDSCHTDFLLNERGGFNDIDHPRLDSGQGIIATRHEEWMNVYSGNKVVKCCYCGAFNQVPARRSGEYKCYFCWKKL